MTLNPVLSVFIDSMHVDEVQIDGGSAEDGMAGNTENPGKRLIVLEADEVEALYGRPRFTHEERVQYFALSPKERAVLDQLHSKKSRLYFILQLGYFKARRMFFIFHLKEVTEDVRYVRDRYFPDFQDGYPTIAKGTRLKQQGLILELCNCRSWKAGAQKKLDAKARQAAIICAKPIYVFRELIHYLANQRIVAPGYSTMQDTVGRALVHEERRLASVVQSHLTGSDAAVLNGLLEDSQGLYEITLLKRDPRDFSNGEIKSEIGRGDRMSPLYHLAQKLLPDLKISNENVKYYASLVGYYSVHRLRQLDEGVVYVYLLCFVHHRYQKLHDNLIQSLIYHVRRHSDEAKAAAKEQVYTWRVASNADLQKAGQVLRLFTDDSVAESEPFGEVRIKAFAVLEPARLNSVANYMATKARFDEIAFQWEHIDRAAPSFKRHIRPILQGIEFATPFTDDPLIEAVHFLKAAFRKGKPLGHYVDAVFPTRCIPDKSKRYLYLKEAQRHRSLLPDRYEFFVYKQLRQGLEAGDVFCRDSVRFRSFEDDLVDDGQWKDKKKLIAETGLSLLKQPIREHLAELEEQLESRIAEVNRRIAAGENGHFAVIRSGRHARWTLRYPCESELLNHPFFDQLKQVEISSILHFVNRHCRFMNAFEHVLGRYAKQEADDHVLTACLTAWATNMGLGRMGEISDISFHTLVSASDNFIRPETLREANNRISNAIAKLSIFRHYDIGDAIHSSSDGQKFETSIHTLNARHSPKYFGLKKGVVSYTLVANNVPINAFIIGANEHESHYVFDILFNNTTDIQPEIHSTDTHGTNEVNFALLHLFGYQFAPRYKDLYDKVRTSMHGFQHPSRYGNAIIRPMRKVRKEFIINEWDNVQRILVSLALKATTQSTIVSKLSAYARNNKTKRALWEYDNIIQSLYLLNYIDSASLRQNVQRAVNRGESYHQLRRTISYANYGKLRFGTEYEQHLWSECSRLIANCIVYYNATLLSHLLAHKESRCDTQGAAIVKQASPVAWQHINLYGRYEFRKQPEPVNVDEIVRELAEIRIGTETPLAA
jgi:TnpA family transposase